MTDRDPFDEELDKEYTSDDLAKMEAERKVFQRGEQEDSWPVYERIRKDPKQWPEPTMDPPTMEDLEEWVWDSVCPATDGCMVEPDGICQHGHVSWLLYKGLI